ncbi:deoxyguanosinetriphosphate triphosphohydrolase [Moraxella caviae]|uniref:Deoxyguanosinetriphosphate triphosphohydrolase n=1 Tax=Moraxella caviae TaxID=34060 RepID=A0A1S9ZWI3_9GAMM|nr:deoxyguanosinetriphosphate triphosphohydrolase [Moraxella caviae]OOR87787.1 deoxyguanosinetriphosphate triphosphohydrolase [Moraxella caviae]STZ10541.1 Deoxyguanosinetriphosphate triphosphohydrolase [Moraxella caviae]VEW11342.1 Deoxyguanosinetriphosphate triphosphohydrolase [Moraxella caviae]
MSCDKKSLQNQWLRLLSSARLRPKHGEIIALDGNHDSIDVPRTPFHMDYDRVVFSERFRRLGRKTQVHPFAQSDFTHNRLTHSVEVASVGRSLGNQIGVALKTQGLLPETRSISDVSTTVQVACLAHDLGNPPFGHVGEDALKAWFAKPEHGKYLQELTDKQRADISTYEGNAHSMRIVASLEMYAGAGGMRLTAASLGTLMKYPWGSDHEFAKAKGKFNFYQSELPLVQAVAHELNLPQLGETHWARHPLSYLMEAADDICYALLDLEDAVELELISASEFETVLRHILPADHKAKLSQRTRYRALRGSAIGIAVEDVAHTFMQHHDAILCGEFEYPDLLSAAKPAVQETLAHAKQMAHDKIFHHHSKLATEIAAFGCLGSLMDLLIPTVHEFVVQGKPLNKKHLLALKLIEPEISADDTLYQAYLKVLDFIGGMTDNRAATLARQLSGVGML